jgi:hypothetical protein
MKGSFVTAHISGEDPRICVQGFYVGDLPNGHIRVMGEGGEQYECDRDVVIVPDEHLLSSTLAWVNKLRRVYR